MNNTLNTRIILCNDTTLNWGESTKVLLKGEVGLEFLEDGSVKTKVGNGVDVWVDLPYSTMTPSEIQSMITAVSHTHNNLSILQQITSPFTTALKEKLDGITASADSVSFTRSLTSGTKVGTLTINGAGTDLYAPMNTDTTYDLGASASAANGNAKVNLTGSNSTTDSITIKGAGSVSVTSDANGVISVTGTDTKYTHPNSGVTAGTYKSVTVNAQGHVTAGTNPTTLAGYGITDAVKSSEKGSANGVATLGSDGKVPSSQLPSYVDDVIEGYLSGGKLYKESAHTTEITGESGKIYVDLTSGKTYRWSGTAFVVISETIALGENSSTAYRGDRGKIAYDHSQSAHAPSNAEANQNAFSNVTVGSTTVAAGAKTDTLTIAAGSNVTITPDATNKKVTIAAKDTTYSAATTSAAGLMSAADKTKLDGIATGANNYVHPTTAGNKHIPAGGSSGQILRWSADGTAVWGNDTNTTYTLSSFGLTATAAELNYCDGVTSNIQTQINSVNTNLNNKADKTNTVITGTFSQNRLADSDIGTSSHAEGQSTTASGSYSHAEGYNTTANKQSSHAEGYNTTASGSYSHAEGYNTKTTGDNSHAEGCYTTASGTSSHAEGQSTTASGLYSHAEGCNTTALAYQHVQGHYNNTTLAGEGSNSGTSGTAFIIGNGYSSSKSNACRITYAGAVIGKAAYASTGADYAEFREWKDGNPDKEDRRGYFVTMDGIKIKIASPGDYICGIISANPSVIGNNDEDWLGRYVFDDFGSFVYETIEETDPETGETHSCVTYKENPDYDPTREYTFRADRPEWDYVGLCGVINVRDDGTCETNGFCKCAEGGIATKSNRGYRVLERVNDHIVKVLFYLTGETF